MQPVFKMYEPSKTTKMLCRFVQVFLGYDLGYFEYKSPKTKCLTRCFCVLQSIILNILFLINICLTMSMYDTIWFGALVVKNFLYALIFNLVKSDTVLSGFQIELNRIELALKSGKAIGSVKKKLIFTLFIFLCYKLFVVLCYIFKKKIFSSQPG